MKNYSIYQYKKDLRSATGPWEYAFTVKAIGEQAAMQMAESKLGTSGIYQVYESAL